ncbi:MAG: class II aldolase/adducin family protein [Sinobacteraceae bacterium]|nr:class II aldolase/adducin family protein [Nevskiaceae bacterium]
MDQAAARQVVGLYRELARRGMNAGSTGNVSLRTAAGMAITPSGFSPDALTPKRVVEMALDGKARGKTAPSSEWEMHALIYTAYPQAHCIVHTHADACTALACLAEGLPAFHYMIANFGGNDVRCTGYATFGTRALADLAVAALAERSACLLANHGMIVHGQNADETLSRAILLETLCRQYLLARAAGTVRLLTATEMQRAHQRFKYYGDRSNLIPPRL